LWIAGHGEPERIGAGEVFRRARALLNAPMMVCLEQFSAISNGLEQRRAGLNCSKLPSDDDGGGRGLHLEVGDVRRDLHAVRERRRLSLASA
jgi:hypothetical protein